MNPTSIRAGRFVWIRQTCNTGGVGQRWAFGKGGYKGRSFSFFTSWNLKQEKKLNVVWRLMFNHKCYENMTQAMKELYVSNMTSEKLGC